MKEISHQNARDLMIAAQGSLSPRDQQALDGHLETCSACRAYQHGLEATQERLRRSLHRRWAAARAQLSIRSIQSGSRRQNMIRKVAMTAGSLAVIALMALAVRGLSGTLSKPSDQDTPVVAVQAQATKTPTPTPGPQASATPRQAGSALIRLSQGLSPEEAKGPVVWSPDRKHIIFQSDADDLLYAVNPDGSGLAKLVDFPTTLWDWPANATAIQLCAGQPGRLDTRIYSVGFDGSQLADITNPAVSAALQGSCEAAFTMNSSRIAFTRDHGEKGLFVMDADGTNLRRVTDPNLHGISNPSWSGDGFMLYFDALDSASGDTASHVYQARIDNGGLKIEPRKLSSSEENALFPLRQLVQKLPDVLGERISAHGLGYALASPDGSRIAFTSNATGYPHVFVINADGTDLRFYPLPFGRAQVESWSPDGGSLVFSTDTQSHADPGSLYLINIHDLQPYNPATSGNAPICKPAPDPYIVKPGDSLINLAIDYGVPVESIIALNHLDAQGSITVGQLLHIPRNSLQANAAGIPETIFDYQVQPGDTIASIAALFQIPAGTITDLNNLDPQGGINVGQLLGIPLHCWSPG